MSRSNSFENLKTELLELSYLGSTLAILGWDEQIYMPSRGARVRAQTTSYLSGLLHQKFTSPEFEKILNQVRDDFENNKLSETQSAVVREVIREFDRSKKLPTEFVKELSELTSISHQVWVESRRKNDYKIFLPYLKKIIDLKIKQAEYLGFQDSPYDALLEGFEPYIKTSDLEKIFSDLKIFLVPFLKKIKSSRIKIDPKIINGNFDEEIQKQFLNVICHDLGFDFATGRLDISHHPFTTQFHPEDVRITTRFDRQNIWPAVGSTIHEIGHALYELGIPAENFGTPLGESVSLGIHESQSRVWENQVGKSLSFWKYFYPKLRKTFPEPFSKISLNDFYKIINFVKPSLIRTEADEVTYNLHIIIRFEIEKYLIEGKIKNLKELPSIWNQKYQDYLGVKVPNDSLGILQDVHWSGGAIAYFPTYTLGNLYSAQIYNTAKKEIPDLEEKFTKGDFKKFRVWLKKHIHIHGKFYNASDLIKNVTGEELNSKYFNQYIEEKYSKIYRLK